jgi:hypothetical protein
VPALPSAAAGPKLGAPEPMRASAEAMRERVVVERDLPMPSRR